MANPTYAQAKALLAGTGGFSAEDRDNRILSLLAILASGQNPDGTTNTAGGGASGSATSYDSDTGSTDYAVTGVTSSNYFRGYSFCETTGTASAVVEIYDAVDASNPDKLLLRMVLLPNESWDNLAYNVTLSTGLFVNRVSGTTAVTVYYS